MRLSPWGRVVAISALLVVGGAIALAVGALARRASAAGLLPGHGRARGPAFDLADGDIEIVGGGRRDAVAGPAHASATRSGARRGRGAAVDGRRLHASLALPDLAARPVQRRLPGRRARQRRARHPHDAAGTSRCAATAARREVATDERRDRHRRLLRQLARRPRRRRATITLDAVCAPPRLTLRAEVAAPIHAALPPGRYDIDAESDVRRRAACAASRRATTRRTRVQVLSGSGDVDGGGPVVIAALELDRPLHPRRATPIAYLAVTLPVTLLALPAVAAARARRRAQRGRDRAAAAARRGGALPRARAARPRAPPTAGWARRCRRSRRRVARRAAARSGSSLDLLSDRALWRMATHLALRPLLVVAMLVVALLPVFVVRAAAGARDRGLAGVDDVDYVGPWALGPGLGVVLLALALPAAALPSPTLETLYRVLCVITHALLVPRTPPGGPVREMLAESLGDRTVSVAYWLPDRERFVDEHGRPVELPAARLGPRVDGGRARRPAARGDHPRRGAGHDAASW